MSDPAQATIWKMTATGITVAAVTAIVTGLTVANRTAPPRDARLDAPSAAPTAVMAQPGSHAAQAPTGTATERRDTPPDEAIDACNRQAASQTVSSPRERATVNGGTLYGIWDDRKNDARFRAAYGACMKARGHTTSAR
jgi:hypothetical protein